jgi:hypothetical protein
MDTDEHGYGKVSHLAKILCGRIGVHPVVIRVHPWLKFISSPG